MTERELAKTVYRLLGNFSMWEWPDTNERREYIRHQSGLVLDTDWSYFRITSDTKGRDTKVRLGAWRHPLLWFRAKNIRRQFRQEKRRLDRQKAMEEVNEAMTEIGQSIEPAPATFQSIEPPTSSYSAGQWMN